MNVILKFIKKNKEYVVIILILTIILFFAIQIIKFSSIKPFIYLLNNF